jgi:putative ABC transport system permease protein
MMSQFRSWWSAATRRTRFEDEMRAEMEFHLQARVDDLIASGVAPAAAQRQARMEFGTADAIKDDCRQSRGLRFLDTTIQDVRYAWRMMRKTPGFTAAAIISLALGIGANTAIFTLVEAVMLRTMPIAEPDRLFYFAHGTGDNPGLSSNYGLFEQYAALTDVFDGVTAYNTNGFKVTTPDGVESVDGLWVSGNFHAVAGVPMALGRGFAAERDRDVGGSMIAVISDHYWARRFNRASDVLGQTLVLNGHSVTVVGVTAPEFTGLQPGTRPDITLPLSIRVIDEKEFLDQRDTWTSLAILGRLKPGVSETQATAAADVTLQQYMARKENRWILERNPEAFASARLLPAAKGSRSLRQRYETPLSVLMALVGLILLIAATNVANLLLVRGEARSKEVAIRLCVGGGRLRLIRQFLTESVLLAVFGALLGFVLAQWGTQAIMAFFESLEQPIFLDVSPNLRVLAFTTAIAMLTALLFGLTPALKSTRVELTPALKDGGHSGSTKRRWTAGYALVVTQVALGVVVIAVAGLLARSLYNLKTLNAGFNGEHVLVFTLDSYGTTLTDERRTALYADLLGRLRTLPGAVGVAASRSVPIHTSGNARLLDLPGPPDKTMDRAAFMNVITPGYFDTFGIRLLRGRDLNEFDTSTTPRVAVISTAMARLYFGDRDPLGQTFGYQSEQDIRITVVGVVEDTHQMNLREPAPAIVYTPMAQEKAQSWMHFAIRTAQEPAALSSAAVAAARSASKDVVIRYVRTMEQQVNASLVRERLLATFSGGFAALALILAAVGLYGVMSYNVTRRSREIGIRMALGARRGNVLVQVLRQTVVVSMIGIAIGVTAVLLTTKYMTTLLFGLSERDPATLLAVSTMLLITASVAGFFPARRAATIDPVRAIKTE